VVCNSNYDITAYDLKNGQQKWQHSAIYCIRDGKRKIYADSMPTITQSPVIVSGGKVIYSGKDHFVNALDALTGKNVWRFETHGKVSAGATTKDGLVFIGQNGGDHKFYALDEKTGKPMSYTAVTAKDILETNNKELGGLQKRMDVVEFLLADEK